KDPETDPQKGFEWIDIEWLRNNKAKLMNDAKDIFAQDARIVLFSCLTGANLDEKSPLNFLPKNLAKHFPDSEYPKDSGDVFLAEFGDAFLVNGGRID